MDSQLISVLFIGLSAFISLLQGFISARKALKENDKVLTAFAVVFLTCGTVLLLFLRSLTR